MIVDDSVLIVCCLISQGLKHLHDNDMIHMDIKPANIFIGLDGLCKIGDFGLVLELSKVSSIAICNWFIYIYIFTWQRFPIRPVLSASAGAGACDQVNISI